MPLHKVERLLKQIIRQGELLSAKPSNGKNQMNTRQRKIKQEKRGRMETKNNRKKARKKPNWNKTERQKRRKKGKGRKIKGMERGERRRRGKGETHKVMRAGSCCFFIGWLQRQYFFVSGPSWGWDCDTSPPSATSWQHILFQIWACLFGKVGISRKKIDFSCFFLYRAAGTPIFFLLLNSKLHGK